MCDASVCDASVCDASVCDTSVCDAGTHPKQSNNALVQVLYQAARIPYSEYVFDSLSSFCVCIHMCVWVYAHILHDICVCVYVFNINIYIYIYICVAVTFYKQQKQCPGAGAASALSWCTYPLLWVSLFHCLCPACVRLFMLMEVTLRLSVCLYH